MNRFAWILSLSAALAFAAPSGAAAQGRGDRPSDSVPEQYRPPAGMCRIWIAGVAPARQAAPTDCASAVRNRPPNGRVIFGPSLPRKSDRAPGRRETAPEPTTPSRGNPPVAVPRPQRSVPDLRERGERRGRPTDG